MSGMLEGKVAIVTGAGYGLGRATAMAFAKEGAKVTVADIDAEKGQQTVQMVKEAGGEALFVKTDVTKEADVEAMVKKTVDTYGRLDCAHNNAGSGEPPKLLHEITEEQWYRVIDLNLKGVWLCMKHEIKHMINHGGGAIVNTSSVAGLTGSPMMTTYGSSKHGVVGLTRTAALEYARLGIRINAVCPAGMRRTGLAEILLEQDPKMAEKLAEGLPMGRDSDPDEVAQAVVWLCSDAASYVTGHAMAVDGGVVAQ
jgi:NAD(P)-dependent dehydrogenase (short-subunit alcohol dehydrogenase family)